MAVWELSARHTDYDVISSIRRADDFIFPLHAFVNNEKFPLKQLSYTMRLGNLGEQFVLKSRKAFDCQLHFIRACRQHHILYSAQSQDEKTRNAFFLQSLRNDDADLIFYEIYTWGVKADDFTLTMECI